MSKLHFQLEGIGVWAPGISGLEQLQTAAGQPLAPPSDASRPPAAALSPNERRRAPEGVLLAVEVAGQAIGMSGRDPASLLSVFASCRGDQTISDYMCRTLAEDPFALSPTRFHNSVHNAPAGYWGIASGAVGTSSAISTEPRWPGLSLLDAITLALCERQPVLWVCSETRGSGPLLRLSGYTAGMACALVIAPPDPAGSHLRLEAELITTTGRPDTTGHPVAGLLPWLAGLEQGGESRLAISPGQALRLQTWPGDQP
ncbi:beta-ketoacyl synthase chain length factor [Frateuria aurantia]|uniref:Beta-ketoacyl synthase-like N-terminal domain-containing protein n=1 Tax=Frateuria aurantia (strain ATCC 33424 / DSM 6220 / KCTC 2777 / LMG 1558 / NBRC 3245 / NCIMB 13370) TaxID=767434 RepID=H8KZS1_FRAAD|nr:beta-ketoacyl synthase chain length factor [Frateuria aurantia]AFC84582.1 hypothetical protein Fraau_0082 [Frateuria aurantia DSM 6220]